MSEKSSNRRIEFGILADAIDEYCRENNRKFSEVVRAGVAREIGRKKLVGELRGVGRPKKSE